LPPPIPRAYGGRPADGNLERTMPFRIRSAVGHALSALVALAIGALLPAGSASAGPLVSATFGFGFAGVLAPFPSGTVPGVGATGSSTSGTGCPCTLQGGAAFAGAFTTTVPT